MPLTGLIGHTGFVGSNLDCSFPFKARYNTKNIQDIQGEHFELLVCAAPQAKKWWANQNPEQDRELLEQLMNHLSSVEADCFVLTSTIDVFPIVKDADELFDCASQPNHPYGQHRLMMEQFALEHFPVTHIVRLPALFGRGLKKNILFDFLNQNQLEKINPNSKFQWYDVSRLWADIQLIRQNDIRLIVLATEPLQTSDIQAQFFPHIAIGADASPTAAYDIKTRYASVFEGSDGYILSKAKVLEDIGDFIRRYGEA